MPNPKAAAVRTRSPALGGPALARAAAPAARPVNPRWAGWALGGRPGVAVSKPDDPLEHEADRVARQVVAMPDAASAPASTPAITQRATGALRCACGSDCAGACTAVARKAATPHKLPAHHAGGSRPGAAAGTLASSLGAGRPLDRATRAFFEPRFGRDFSAVQVHDGAPAHAAARALHAQAFALGPHLAFGAGRYAPASAPGRLLLAHELAHVAQAGPAGLLQRAPDDADQDLDLDDDEDQDEEEAELADLSPTAAEWQRRINGFMSAQEGIESWQQQSDDDRRTWSDLLSAPDVNLDPTPYRRARILMDHWQPSVLPTLADVAAVDARADSALELAVDEQTTITELGQAADKALQDEPEAFPATWAERVRKLLAPDADELMLAGLAAQNWKALLDLGQALPGALLAHGLPVSFNDAATLVAYGLVPGLAQLGEEHAVKHFAQAALNWGLAQSTLDFLHMWNGLANGLVLMIASRQAHVDYAGLAAFKDQQASQVKSVPDLLRQGWQSAPALRGFPAMPDRIAVRIATSHFVHTFTQYDSYWQRPRAVFGTGLNEADARIQALSDLQRVAVGATWADERGYGSAAWKEVGKGLWDQAPEMAGSAAGFTLANMLVPEVMIFVDIYFGAKAAWDAGVTVPREIDEAMERLKASASVVDLQRNEAQLKLVQTGGLARQVLDAIAVLGTAKGVKSHLAAAAERRAATAAARLSEGAEHLQARAKMLETLRDKHTRLEADELAVEAEAAGEAAPRQLHDESAAEFDEARDLPNDHTWKRRREDGVWCRFSPGGECDVRFKPAGAQTPPPAAGASAAPRADVSATQTRLAQASAAEATAAARAEAASARARQASENLRYANAERLKARSAADIEAAKKMRALAQDELEQASKALEKARQEATGLGHERARQAQYLQTQQRKAAELEAALKRYEDFAARSGHVRPPSSQGGLEWDRLQRDVDRLRGELRNLAESAQWPLAVTQDLLRAGSPPKVGTAARQAALDNASANFEPLGLTKDGQVLDLVTRKPLAPGDVSPDHIYPMDAIFAEEGFNLLTYEQQVKILELPENYMPLSRSLNFSKGSRSLAEWFQSPLGKDVPVALRPQLLRLEELARVKVREQIVLMRLQPP